MRFSPPADASQDGHLVDGAISHLTLTTGIAFLALVLVLAVTLLFFRERARRPHAYYTHGDRARDHVLTFAVALVMFVAVDVTLALRSATALAERFWRYPDGQADALRVEVMARQWSWTFRTAGTDGRFGTPDDIVTLNQLDVPVGKPVYLKLRSKDVVHSLYLPSFRTKIDAIPGTTTRLWFQPTETGRYEIGCAQHCGVGHYKMRGVLAVRTPQDYQGWLTRADADARLRYDPADTEAHDGWSWEAGP